MSRLRNAFAIAAAATIGGAGLAVGGLLVAATVTTGLAPAVVGGVIGAAFTGAFAVNARLAYEEIKYG